MNSCRNASKPIVPIKQKIEYCLTDDFDWDSHVGCLTYLSFEKLE